VLVICCGSGMDAEYLARQGAAVIAVLIGRVFVPSATESNTSEG
jgi:2-polyprenyl-3-methyl-5-hydroxy-6-metoxy-1,4-benzoquinol methylase